MGAVSAPVGAAVGPVALWASGAVPRVPWSTVASPWFLAVVVGIAAWQTWRTLGGPPPWRRLPEGPDRGAHPDDAGQPGRPGTPGDGRPRAADPSDAGSRSRQVGAGRRLAPHQAVNRLVLGKAAALAGAVCAGAYVGFAVVAAGGVDRQLDAERVGHSLVAAAGGVALLVAGVLLERACRTPEDPAPDLA